MTTLQKIGRVHTTVERGDYDESGDTERVAVCYHETDVVTALLGADKIPVFISLSTGGWLTVTTKVRMNQAANELGLNFQVYQEKHKWTVCVWSKANFSGERQEYTWDDPEITDFCMDYCACGMPNVFTAAAWPTPKVSEIIHARAKRLAAAFPANLLPQLA